MTSVLSPFNAHIDPHFITENRVKNATKPIESHCLQNGTWTRVQLNCVRDPSVPDVLGNLGVHRGGNSAGGTAADGGFLVGPGSGLGANKDGWTMMAISVVVAVILGTAVAFLILFVKRW